MNEKLIKSLNGMGIGLFATLIVGTILNQLGILLDLDLFINIGSIAKVFMAGAIGAAVAYSLDAPPLVIFSSIVTSSIGAAAIKIVDGSAMLTVGDPAGAYVAALVTTIVGKRIFGKTYVDIILVPAICIIVGGITGLAISPIISKFIVSIGSIINNSTELHPAMMGAIVSTLMGMVLISPLSSAALAASLGLSGLAAGAAVVGTSCQMIGFAVISYKENGVEGLLAQGLGTSKIQFGNIVQNPLIAIPSIVASFIIGMVATTVFKMSCNSVGAGMGTSGLVGQIQTVAEMGIVSLPKILILHFILPGIISYIIAFGMKKMGYIKEGDMIIKNK
ncbi:PTS sugar transporter subunit IIC [Clostridium sp.]|uniref:PTS transporter subunit IIC n=1 Tax=Clostridium sp. TaxID=1506 RepID=UPI0032162904